MLHSPSRHDHYRLSQYSFLWKDHFSTFNLNVRRRTFIKWTCGYSACSYIIIITVLNHTVKNEWQLLFSWSDVNNGYYTTSFTKRYEFASCNIEGKISFCTQRYRWQVRVDKTWSMKDLLFSSYAAPVWFISPPLLLYKQLQLKQFTIRSIFNSFQWSESVSLHRKLIFTHLVYLCTPATIAIHNLLCCLAFFLTPFCFCLSNRSTAVVIV